MSAEIVWTAIVLSMTHPDQTVFDPYMGAGSSLIAAVKNGREGFGCDIDPGYVQIARDRVEELRAGLLKTRPMDRPIYDPSLPNGGQR